MSAGPDPMDPAELGRAPTDESAGPITAEDAATDPDTLLEQFRLNASRPGADWRLALIQTMALWPLSEEELDGRRFVYLIAGEAFDWRSLAERLLAEPDLPVPDHERELLLTDPQLPAGLDEEEFRRRLGFDKARALMNYFYGVTVEQALLLAVEEEVRKRRYARGFSPSDDSAGSAYDILYSARLDDLMTDFEAETGETFGRRVTGAPRTQGNLRAADRFTYWLFKRRFKIADPARIASDTRKGLEQLERMRLAHTRLRVAARAAGPVVDEGPAPKRRRRTGARR